MPYSGRLLRASALAMLVAFAPAISVAGHTGQTGTLSSVNADISSIRVGNFGRINASYYRGAQPEGHDYADLAALGIRTVIDLQKDGDLNEEGLVESTGMNFYRIPMTTHEPPTPEKLTMFLKLVNDPANQPVYVHCAGGRHRTGIMTAVYRMTTDGWSADRSFKEMKRYKFGADFLHPEFKRFVYAYPTRTASAGAVVATNATR